MRKSHITAVLAAACGLAAFGASSAQAQLLHQYTFNDGTGADSVGTADGALVGTASITGGQLNTSVGGNFLSLPKAATTGITGAFTIEDFVTVSGSEPADTFTSLFSFATDQQNFLLANPHRPATGGTTTANFARTGGTQFNIFGAGVTAPRDTQFVYTLTYDPTAGANGNGQAFLYLDGVQVADGTANAAGTDSLSAFNLDAVASAAFSSIGGGGPFNDPTLTGTTDEFRIYGNALSAADVLASFQAGPTGAIPEPTTLGLLGVAGLGLLRRRRAI